MRMKFKYYFIYFLLLLLLDSSSCIAQRNDSVPTKWTEDWHEHRENLTLMFVDEHVAVYFDPEIPSSISWPFPMLSNAWKYVKETYGSFGPDPHLYVIFHGDTYNGCHTNTFLNSRHGYRNVLDCGCNETDPWLLNSTKNAERLLTTFGHIIRNSAYGIKNSADENICGEQIREILSYDVFLHVSGESAVAAWKGKKLNEMTLRIFWFKDWFLPIYDKFGGIEVLQKFLKLVYEYAARRNKAYVRLNRGEFIHFWSGAAATDLQSFAQTTFGSTWNDQVMNLLIAARINFPGITYPVSKTTPVTSKTPMVSLAWEKKSGEHKETLRLKFVNNDVAVYLPETGDHFLSKSDFQVISNMWSYSKTNFGPWTLNDQNNSTLFIVFYDEHFGTKCISSNNNTIVDIMFDSHHVIECPVSLYPEKYISIFDSQAISSVTHIPKEIAFMTLKLFGGSGVIWPIREISGWTMTSILVYDILLGLEFYEDAEMWREVQFKLKDSHFLHSFGIVEDVFWFRDWYFQIYEFHGGLQVLSRFLSLIRKEILEANNDGVFKDDSKQLNMGEWVHFWSEAANEDLFHLASSVFGYNILEFQKEFLNAWISYPGFNYCPDCKIQAHAISDQGISEESNKIAEWVFGIVAFLVLLGLGVVVVKCRRKIQNWIVDVRFKYLKHGENPPDAARIVDDPSLHFSSV